MSAGIDQDTYAVLCDRLVAQSGELARRAEALNQARITEFGSGELTLAATDRIRTESNGLARDIVAVGDDVLLFGRRTTSSDRAETSVSDVFGLYDRELNPLPEGAVPGLLDDPDFVREFTGLHRYFRGTRLLRLRRLEGRLLAVFQTGVQADDLRVLRWSVGRTGETRFLDAQGERDHISPPSQDVEWVETTRDDHVLGRHPHVSLDGRLFVSTAGGALTMKTENDTETGEGVHSEPVDEPLQSLADAEVAYATVGALIVVRVRPYKEETRRHLVFNTLTETVVRLDGIGQACLRLPDDQGVLFPGGYCLASGAVRTFDVDAAELTFERAIRSPNGEDILFVFHAQESGRSLLLPYNRIRQEVATPLSCHGYALLDDGTMVVLRAEDGQPSRAHPAQIWRTPYVADTHVAPRGEGPLARVGNADLVRGISDCLAIARQAVELTPAGAVYESLVAACERAHDVHHWLGDPDTGDLRGALAELRGTAAQVLVEFEAVTALTRQASDALAESAQQVTRLVRRIRGEAPASAEEWIGRITELRQAQGRLVTLSEMRYADTESIDALAADVEGDIASAAQRAVAFLRREDAFTVHHREAETLAAEAGELTTVAGAGPVGNRLDEHTLGLRTLSEIIAGLDIGDATVRTSILQRIGEVLGSLNRARAVLTSRRAELLDQEGRAEFAAELALLSQAVTGALAAADTPDRCEDQLGHLLLQLENLDSRFAEHDGFVADIGDRRTEIHDAFTARKQSLQDARARRAERLSDSAGRVLAVIARRASTLGDRDAVHTYFASDPMVAKVRHLAARLRELGDHVRAEELDGRLGAARQEADRALRDRTDLFSDDGDTIRLGRHRFAVNRQASELTLVPYEDTLAFALTGTDYRAPVIDPEFAATRPYWNRALPSESHEVYRAEHLAARLLAAHGPDGLAGADLVELARRAAEAAYDEGYERGVHDHDAAAILETVLKLREGAGLLRYPAKARAAAQTFWDRSATAEAREEWTRRAVSLAQARDLFGSASALDGLERELAGILGDATAAEYLVAELASGPPGFAVSAQARALLHEFRGAVVDSAYDETLAGLTTRDARRQLVEAWITSYASASAEQIDEDVLTEAVAVELSPDLDRYEVGAPTTATATGLLGAHPRVAGGVMQLRLDEYLARTRAFADADLPAFRDYQRQRAKLVAAERAAARGRVPSSGRVVLRPQSPRRRGLPPPHRRQPRQAARCGRRRDADRHPRPAAAPLPARLRQDHTDRVRRRPPRPAARQGRRSRPRPEHALPGPRRSARRRRPPGAGEDRLRARGGNNVLLYLDDIQHTAPEFLQKFIPLCDATRTLGGHDLRGKRFAVCMAGNPYTETGQRFRLPDMLANRADVWNLGDVLTGRGDAFALSFVENALTSHPDLAPLAGRDRTDLELLTRLAAGDPTARRDRLTHPYAPAELDRVLAVLRHLLTARATVLAVNAAYMASAAQSDDARTEPPFRLQGSYRNMNKIVARISPAMNDAELAAVIDDHYTAEAQTLTTEAEANLLKLAALRGTLTPSQAARWAEVTSAHVRTRALGGAGEDPPPTFGQGDPHLAALGRAVAALGLLADRITAVETAISRATADLRHAPAHPGGRHAV